MVLPHWLRKICGLRPSSARFRWSGPLSARFRWSGPLSARFRWSGPLSARFRRSGPLSARFRRSGPLSARFRRSGPLSARFRRSGPLSARFRRSGPLSARFRRFGPLSARFRRSGPLSARFRRSGPLSARFRWFGPLSARFRWSGPLSARFRWSGPLSAGHRHRAQWLFWPLLSCVVVYCLTRHYNIHGCRKCLGPMIKLIFLPDSLRSCAFLWRGPCVVSGLREQFVENVWIFTINWICTKWCCLTYFHFWILWFRIATKNSTHKPRRPTLTTHKYSLCPASEQICSKKVPVEGMGNNRHPSPPCMS